MQATTLVLDQGYQPLGVVDWQRAITLLWEGKIQVLHEYEDKVVRSVSLEIPVPAVVRFLSAVRSRKKGVKFSRENVWSRDKGECQYCGRKVDRREATFDHAIPRAKNGTTHWGNIVIACYSCNQKKGGRTPEEAGMILRTKPAQPKMLPQAASYLMEWRKGMPESWRAFLRDQAASAEYWHAELEKN